MVKKSVTLDDLAEMVNRGFDDVSSRMATKIDVDERFDGVDERFEQVDKRFERIEERLIYIERDISDIKKHIVYRDEFEDLMSRVKYLEVKAGIESGK